MLKYKLVQRKDMTKGALENAKLYYPQVINQGRVSFDSLSIRSARKWPNSRRSPRATSRTAWTA